MSFVDTKAGPDPAPESGWSKPTQHRAYVVILCTVALVGGAGIWYWYTHIHIQQPALRSVRCEWKGNQVRVSGIAYNPNGTARAIDVMPRFRLAGTTQIQFNHLEIGPRHDVPARGTARWSYTSAPLGVWHTGQRITACNTTAVIRTGRDD